VGILAEHGAHALDAGCSEGRERSRADAIHADDLRPEILRDIPGRALERGLRDAHDVVVPDHLLRAVVAERARPGVRGAGSTALGFFCCFEYQAIEFEPKPSTGIHVEVARTVPRWFWPLCIAPENSARRRRGSETTASDPSVLEVAPQHAAQVVPRATAR
jgi:hypothetical protein